MWPLSGHGTLRWLRWPLHLEVYLPEAATIHCTCSQTVMTSVGAWADSRHGCDQVVSTMAVRDVR